MPQEYAIWAGSWHRRPKRLGEVKAFSGAFVVFLCISANFSSNLFGGNENFRIFAVDKKYYSNFD